MGFLSTKNIGRPGSVSQKLSGYIELAYSVDGFNSNKISKRLIDPYEPGVDDPSQGDALIMSPWTYTGGGDKGVVWAILVERMYSLNDTRGWGTLPSYEQIHEVEGDIPGQGVVIKGDRFAITELSSCDDSPVNEFESNFFVSGYKVTQVDAVDWRHRDENSPTAKTLCTQQGEAKVLIMPVTYEHEFTWDDIVLNPDAWDGLAGIDVSITKIG